jgi:beta-lactam-binding protein with PASTA domain
VPALEGQNLLNAIVALNQAGIQAFVVEVERDGAEPGVVFSQSPTAGSPVEDDTVVTLMAGR